MADCGFSRSAVWEDAIKLRLSVLAIAGYALAGLLGIA
jgi:hypothetical protein